MPRFMLLLLLVFLAVALVRAASEDFAGPFPSWTNVKTVYGAAGDGVTDDTGALQKALDGLEKHSPAHVLYLPAGTYRITRGLTMTGGGYQGSIIGQHPRFTVIKWDGGHTGVMLNCGHLAVNIKRLTWDGAGKEVTAVLHECTGRDPGTLGLAHSDDVFTNLAIGVRAELPEGVPPPARVEPSLTQEAARSSEAGVHALSYMAAYPVLRCKFQHCRMAGVRLCSDLRESWLIRDCEFVRCVAGVCNDPDAGHYQVYSCVFHDSTAADIVMRRCASFSIRHNTSLAATLFLDARGADKRGIPLAIQHNTIIDPRVLPTMVIANPGPVLLLENTVLSRSNLRHVPMVQLTPPVAGDLAAAGNNCTEEHAIRTKGRFLDLDEAHLLNPSGKPSIPFLPLTPPNSTHPIIEVKAGADAGAIQSALDRAATLAGKGPVVHLPAGDYAIAQTLTIPAGVDVRLIGDGGDSVLRWTGAEGGVVLRLAGPSKALLSDFTIQAAGKAAGMLAENCDQPNAHIVAEQVSVDGGQIGLRTRLAHTYVELHDFSHTNNQLGVQVDGGNPPANAAWNVRGHVAIFGGASSNTALGYQVSGGASLLVQDQCYSGWGSMVKLSGAGSVTFNGGNLTTLSGGSAAGTPPPDTAAAKPADVPGIILDNFLGNATFLGVACNTRVQLLGDGKQANVLLLGAQSPTAELLPHDAPATVVLLNSRCYPQTEAQPSTALPDRGTPAPSWLRKMLDQANTLYPRPFAPLPAELTELSLYRVRMENCTTGLELKGK